jgi:hypothetical protein
MGVYARHEMNQIYDELLGLDAIDWNKRAVEDSAV